MFFFFFTCYGAHRHLHSFPTRRSSDLAGYGFHADVTAAGVFLLPSTFVMLVAGPLSGVIGTRFGSRLPLLLGTLDRKSTRLNSSHVRISYAVFCLKKKKQTNTTQLTAL